MKTNLKWMALVILLAAGCWLMPGNVQAHRWSHYEIFYHELSPYGTWINNPDYGYVWIPNVTPGFHPYSTSGYWMYTIYGWTWISYYPWGWAPFHYGRWYYDNWYGWVWVPGTEWGPAWVSWSHYGGYYGWAPLAPGFYFSPSFNMHVDIPIHYWVYVHGKHFGERHQERYHMDGRNNHKLYNNSRLISSTVYDNERNTRNFSGPEVKEIRKASGRDFKPDSFKEDRNKSNSKNSAVPHRGNSQYSTPNSNKSKDAHAKRSESLLEQNKAKTSQTRDRNHENREYKGSLVKQSVTSTRDIRK